MPDTWTWTELRTQTVARLTAASVCGGAVEKSRFVPIVADGQARVRVYLRAGNYTADGSPRAGEPHFERTRSVVVSITRAAGIDDDLDDDLDSDIDAVLAALLTSPAWLAGVEGVAAVQVDYDAQTGSGADGLGEWRSIEAIIRIDVVDSERFAPVIPDDLETVQVETDRPGADAATPLGATWPIETE